MIIATIILFLLLILTILTLTNVPLKIIRRTIDQQYGKSYSAIRFDESRVTQEDYTWGPILLVEKYKRQIDERRVVEKKPFVTWPRLLNFFDEWKDITNQETVRENDPRRLLTNKRTLRYTRNDTTVIITTKRKCLVFIHGGGLIAGSPTKYNSFNWITTIAWMLGRQAEYTDLLTLKYSLSPESESPQALRDCLCEIHEFFEQQGNSLEEITIVGFSAGAFLALQIALAWEYFAKRGRNSTIFGICGWEVFGDEHKNKNTIVENTIRKIIDKRIRMVLHLCAGFVRFDRLFMNRHIDVSHLLATYMRVYSKRYETDDPLYNAVTHDLNLSYATKINIFDVHKNSLSNHGLTLRAYLRQVERQRTKNTTTINYDEEKKHEIVIFHDEDFRLNEDLLRIIRTGDSKDDSTRTKLHKFVRNIETYRPTQRRELIDNVHYHFFPFIVAAEASWKCMRKIICDTSNLNSG